jgi:chemotaxis signal transduction protein
MAENAPFELLSSMRDAAVELAAQGLTYSTQSAGVKNIAYIVNGVNFYCDARDVKEVSTCDNLMVIPQTKDWMRGLINSKGVLYSVTDLSIFAGFGRAIQTNKGHLLLLSEAGAQCSLLVNRVIGFRYFEEANKIEELDSSLEAVDGLAPFVEEGYSVEGQNWFRLDVEKLLAAEQFREVQ